jgi:hypothetical protein
MDIDKIFNLFNDNSNIQNNDKKTSLKDSPFFYIGMFKKINYYYNNFSDVLFFKNLDEELDVSDMKRVEDFIKYNRAWFWIQKINISDESSKNALILYSDISLKTYLENIIYYFESYEEYEKCAFLKKILDIVNLNLDM